MRKDPITKLYDSLTNQERARLAFQCLTEANEIEFERIGASAPRKTYRCPDAEYRHLLDGFFNMAALWAVEHWKLQAKRLAALAGLHMLAQTGPSKLPDMVNACMDWEARLMAADDALLAVCEEYGIDPEAVLRLAEAEPFIPTLEELEADAAYQAQLQASMARLMPSKKKAFEEAED